MPSPAVICFCVQGCLSDLKANQLRHWLNVRYILPVLQNNCDLLPKKAMEYTWIKLICSQLPLSPPDIQDNSSWLFPDIPAGSRTILINLIKILLIKFLFIFTPEPDLAIFRLQV